MQYSIGDDTILATCAMTMFLKSLGRVPERVRQQNEHHEWNNVVTLSKANSIG